MIYIESFVLLTIVNDFILSKLFPAFSNFISKFSSVMSVVFLCFLNSSLTPISI